MSTPRSNGVLDTLLIVGFLAALLAPGAAYLTSHDEAARADEIRLRERQARLKPLPTGDVPLVRRPQRFEGWWGQRIGLRTPLLKLRGRLWWQLLGEAPGDRMVRGADGWMFLSRHAFLPEERGFLDGWRGARPAGEDELDAWVALFAERAAWCQEHGIAYLPVFAPQKASVYPERVPARFERVGPSVPERLRTQLEARAGALFLEPALSAARENDRAGGHDHLYHPSGTHWSGRGAAVAYTEIVDELRRRGVTGDRAWSTFDEVACRDDRDSWELRLYLDGLVPRMREEWVPVSAPELVRQPLPGTRGAERLTRGDGSLGIVLVHDSFGGVPIPPSEAQDVSPPQVRELLALHGPLTSMRVFRWDRAAILGRNPDVLIELYVDRMFDQQDPAELRAAELGE